jgi:hypothetical protein
MTRRELAEALLVAPLLLAGLWAFCILLFTLVP